jgi:hypothetical protein
VRPRKPEQLADPVRHARMVARESAGQLPKLVQAKARQILDAYGLPEMQSILQSRLPEMENAKIGAFNALARISMPTATTITLDDSPEAGVIVLPEPTPSANLSGLHGGAHGEA